MPTSGKPTELDVPGGAVVVFRREGGIAGLSEQWTIFPDGRVQDADGNQYEIEPAAVTAMLAAIESAGFMELDNSGPPADLCCDRFVYTLAVRLGDRVHTMQTVDGAEDVPEGLIATIDAVQSVVERLPPAESLSPPARRGAL
jgi:hypothetical protein